MILAIWYDLETTWNFHLVLNVNTKLQIARFNPELKYTLQANTDDMNNNGSMAYIFHFTASWDLLSAPDICMTF